MIEVTNLYLFIISGILLNLIPGPDSLFIMANSVKYGIKTGLLATFSIFCGTLVHILAATFGLSAILASSAYAFLFIKIIGCLYLLYMGFSMLIKKEIKTKVQNEINNKKPLEIFYLGFLTNALNPKVALFFLAFVPQFIDANATYKELNFIFLGLIFNINGFLWSIVLIFSSFYIGEKIKKYNLLSLIIKKFTGALFILFGIKLALSKSSS